MERNSNSLILKNILDNESCELKQMIDSFMSEKLSEFQQQVKTNVDKVVTERINTFYNQPWTELDEVVFDDDCANMEEYATKTTMIDRCARGIGTRNYQECLKLKGQKCFKILEDRYRTPYNGINNRYLYVFKNAYIKEQIYPGSGYNQTHYNCELHTLPTQILFTIKKFAVDSETQRCSIDTLQKYYEEHPQYFQPNCIEFERICQQEQEEFEEITKQSNEIMEEAHKIIDENVDKKEYYASLDARLDQIRIDEERIKEEKQKLLIVKERLLEMKSELEMERRAFEEEKRKLREQKEKSIDINQCFADLL